MATRIEVKVGAFVLVGLIAMGLVVFLIGDERSMFESTDPYAAVFDDVEGLKRGSPVQIGGVDVGSVTEVQHSSDPNDPRVHVSFDVVQRAQGRIRTDSVITISAKGLLGDKMLQISVGSLDKPAVPPGQVIAAGEKGGLMQNLERLGQKADGVMTNLEKTTGSLAEDQFQKDVKGTAQSLRNILQKLDQGDGYGAKLLGDPDEAKKLSETLSSLERTSGELNRTLRSVNGILGRIERGPGFAHDVIYGDTPTKALTQFGDAAGELAATLRGVREGNGVAKSLIYGDDQSQQIVGNVSAMTGDLRRIVADVRAGKGTVGALLVDPSVYEDLKMVLGNVERNQVLRALVRYSIKRDEKAPSVEIADPAPPPKAAGQLKVEATAAP